MLLNRVISLGVLITTLGIPYFCSAKSLSVLVGGGSWYGDETNSSYSYGGGLAWRPSVDWMEVSLTFDRSPIKIKSNQPMAAQIQNDSLHFYRANIHFPTALNVFQREGYFFPTLGYALISNGSQISHGFGIGGGLGILLYEKIFGVRFEAINQYYKIPYPSGGSSALQDDFFLCLRFEFRVL